MRHGDDHVPHTHFRLCNFSNVFTAVFVEVVNGDLVHHEKANAMFREMGHAIARKQLLLGQAKGSTKMPLGGVFVAWLQQIR